MKFERFHAVGVGVLLSLGIAVPAQAVTIISTTGVNGDTTNTAALQSNSGAVLDGSVNALPSFFSKDISSGNPDNGTGTFRLGDVPVFTDIFESQFVGGESFPLAQGYFEFMLDAQQNRGADLFLDSIDISYIDAGNNNALVSIWSYNFTTNNSIQLTPGSNGNNADLALYIPVAAFVAAGTFTSAGEFTGNDNIVFSWTQTGDTGGNDEWGLRQCGNLAGAANFAGCFDTDIVVELPIPATLPLLLAGIGGLAWVSRRRRGPKALA